MIYPTSLILLERASSGRALKHLPGENLTMEIGSEKGSQVEEFSDAADDA
jgi:hypothetical protein